MGGGVDGSGPKAKWPFLQLFEIVGHPSGHPRHREEDLAGIGRHPRGPRHGGQSEVDIGWRDGVFGGELEQRPDQLGILGTGHFVEEVEQTTVDVLAELKPGRRLYTNVEFFAGVVMHSCRIPRDMFTPTFASGRIIGWSAHVMEQVADNRLIRPAARYVGPPPPQPVPAR